MPSAASAPCIYLTFDDGPIPEQTPWVLEQLAQYQAKATFFCIGRNVERHPKLYQRILREGHQVGNHTFNHYNGWKYSNKAYINNVEACAQLVDSTLFRPPYGRLRWQQGRALRKAGYQIVMWDVIPGDFDKRLKGEDCWNTLVKHVENGSVIVLHDSIKAGPRLRYILPRLLEYYHKKGYLFKAIPR